MMGTIGKAMKATLLNLIESREDAIAAEFEKRFGMRDGDYLRHERDGKWIQCRIMSVQSVYYNRKGGWSAMVVVSPLLASGRVGRTRTLCMSINANRTGLRAIGGTSGGKLERLSPERQETY